MRTWKDVEMVARHIGDMLRDAGDRTGAWIWSRSSFLQTPIFSIWTFVTNDPLSPLFIDSSYSACSSGNSSEKMCWVTVLTISYDTTTAQI